MEQTPSETDSRPPEPKNEICFVCQKPVEYRLKLDWQDIRRNPFMRSSSEMGWIFFYDRIPHEGCIAELQRRETLERTQMVIAERKKAVAAYRGRVGFPLDMTEKTFERFRPETPEQASALKLSQAWQEADDFGILFMGPAGSGKSHLALAMVNRSLDSFLNSEVPTDVVEHDLIEAKRFPTYWTVADLIAFIKQNDFDFPLGLLDARFLVLDDLGAEQVTDWTREQFFRLFEHRTKRRLATIVTTNLSLNELKDKLHERVVSRIMGICIPVEIKGKDKRRDDMISRARLLADRARSAP
jgi:DNA replication protein DnaC